VIDIAMPRKTGLQALAEIRRHSSAVIAIVISNLESAEAVNLAFDCGANAYLVKDFALPELQQALAATLGGDKYLSPRITAHVLQGARGQLGHGKVMLTPRQFEILRLIADGHTNKEAARELGISPRRWTSTARRSCAVWTCMMSPASPAMHCGWA
jgi:DNA-binding NarL/FixJ family response regulator